MGMFDYVDLPFRCPKCGADVIIGNDSQYMWQTKSTECMLETYKTGDVVYTGSRTGRDGKIELHNGCPKCRFFVIAFAKVKGGRLTGEVEYIKQ